MVWAFLCWTLWSARADEPLREVAVLLSRYEAGEVPATPEVLGAIDRIGAEGAPSDASLLASLVAHESEPTAGTARRALDALRARQRTDQRQRFAATQLPAPSSAGGESARCLAYAEALLGTSVPLAEEGGRARALALEDAGDVRGAVRQYAALAALGDGEARAELVGFGVDPERLLLGMLRLAPDVGAPPTDAKTLDLLVRRGDRLTVAVLAERAAAPTASEAAFAVDALSRMLNPREREVPLRADAERHARLVLGALEGASAP